MPDSLIATTQAGRVRGYEEDGIKVFKGVRYGADAGASRFAAPHPPEPWHGVEPALHYANSALQPEGGDGGGLFKSWRHHPPLPMSEDCLFLNVWTPALRDGAKRPVMVWFHGGGWSTGSGSSFAYDGVRLCRRGDVVVVTVNHRLNTFGYLHLGRFGEAFADSGNAGVLDMVLALEWVRDNIAEFGGDPGNVTIFGESGGGQKVTLLMSIDAARGLVHRGVVQSGPMLTAMPEEDAAAAAQAVVDELSLTADTIEEIRELPAETIQKAVRAAGRKGVTGIATMPVLDDRTVTRHPYNPEAAPQGRDVPMMIGTCRTETSLLTGAAQPKLFDLTWETLTDAVAKVAPGYDAGEIIAGYRRLHPDYSPANLYFTLTTDRGFLRTSMAQADRKADQGGAPVYFYRLDWDTPVDGGKWFCPHALDIGFVFDNVAKSESMSGHGEVQQALADRMSEAWLAFAHSGDPNHAGLPAWPAYTSAGKAMMVFDVAPHVETDARAAERALFRRAPEAVSA